MKRRHLLTALAATGIALTGAGASLGVARLHKSPRKRPFLQDTHLSQLTALPADGPRILFVGNSMILRHDVPARIAALAKADGQRIVTAMAAAEGARLIETLRIAAFRDAVKQSDWDVIVLQDFTKTPLRATDRWGSALAMSRIARIAKPAQVVLFPPWPARAHKDVYTNPGFMTSAPESPADFAALTEVFYRGVAARNNFHMAPIPTDWLGAGDPDFYDKDGHHASPEGAQFVADRLWQTIRALL